jgi:hypothetical protein
VTLLIKLLLLLLLQKRMKISKLACILRRLLVHSMTKLKTYKLTVQLFFELGQALVAHRCKMKTVTVTQ